MARLHVAMGRTSLRVAGSAPFSLLRQYPLRGKPGFEALDTRLIEMPEPVSVWPESQVTPELDLYLLLYVGLDLYGHLVRSIAPWLNNLYFE